MCVSRQVFPSQKKISQSKGFFHIKRFSNQIGPTQIKFILNQKGFLESKGFFQSKGFSNQIGPTQKGFPGFGSIKKSFSIKSLSNYQNSPNPKKLKLYSRTPCSAFTKEPGKSAREARRESFRRFVKNEKWEGFCRCKNIPPPPL